MCSSGKSVFGSAFVQAILKNDWHIHSESSYDATLTLEEIAKRAKENGIEKTGITDHLNFNDEKFISDLKNSVKSVKEFQKKHNEVILGLLGTAFGYDEMNGFSEIGAIVAIAVMGAFIIYFNEKKK